MNTYEQYIALSRYARSVPGASRRETWSESVDRYVDFFKDKTKALSPKAYKQVPWRDIDGAIKERLVMPSMRAVMTAGPALERDNVAGYNCSYIPIDSMRSFDEIMYILMCGTGVGFSVERQYVNKLPEIPDALYDTDTVIRVADSKIGWAKATRELIALLYAGQVPRWDLSGIRPSGSRLVTFGGRASGPEPLDDFFRFAVATFRRSGGRKLNSLECHDLVCKIADVVVCGGVRRSALISLSNLTDERMRTAKHGDFHALNSQRQLANNSVAYTEKPDVGVFLREWSSLYDSKSGERGMFSRPAAKNKAAENGRRDPDHEFGTNPCSEIILRPRQFCNLSEIVARQDDTNVSLQEKAYFATMLGTLQSTLTDFRYLTSRWKANTEEERLLGVSITGIMDCPLIVTGNNNVLPELKKVCVETNERLATLLGTPPSAAITCVKPSGTVSQLVNSASGIHPRHARQYIRRVRQDAKDPLALWMKEKGVPCETDIHNPGAFVFSFPIKTSDAAICRNEVSALEQLELVARVNREWCEHKASVTIYVREHEWLDVGAWVHKNFDSLSGVSFLPYDGGTYRQAPYEDLTPEAYEKLAAAMPVIDFADYRETEDNTIASQELACVGGVCEL